MSLRFAIAWVPRWFVRHESLWSVARKLAASNLASLHQVLANILCPPEQPSTSLFFSGQTHRNIWLGTTLGLDFCDAATVWLDDVSTGPDDASICAGLRYCPQCMKQQFHSVLYQSYLLRNCPVHDVPLTTRCPHCGGLKAQRAVSTDSFSWCDACRAEFFPEPRGWLTGFDSPDYSRQLSHVHRCFKQRADEDHVESPAWEWAREPGKTIPEQVPAYALLGDTLLERVQPLGSFNATLTDCYGDLISPSWGLAQKHAAAVQRELEALGHLVGLPSSLGLPANRRSSHATLAAHLLVKFLGVRPGQDLRRAGRTLQVMALSPVLSASTPFMGPLPGSLLGREAVSLTVGAGMRGLFLDALEWVRAPKAPHSWDQWPLNREALRNPAVWVGRLSARSDYFLVDAAVYGPSVEELRASCS